MTQAQQDVFNLLVPPAELINELIELLSTRHQDGSTAHALRWAKRIQELHQGKKDHILGSLSDAELQGLWESLENADLWAVM